MKYQPKYESILIRCEGKRVLHLGCVGNNDSLTDEKVAASPSTLHMRLSASAKVTGVDLSGEAVEEYKRLGICDNILIGNVENLEVLNLNQEFDIIVIGDLIEHLSNPGLMLDGVRRLCRTDTEVILTTPHAFGLAPFLRHFSKRFKEGRQHVMTFNYQNLTNLIERHGFEMKEINTCYQPQSAHGIVFHIGKILFQFFPHLGGTLFCVLKMKP